MKKANLYIIIIVVNSISLLLGFDIEYDIRMEYGLGDSCDVCVNRSFQDWHSFPLDTATTHFRIHYTFSDSLYYHLTHGCGDGHCYIDTIWYSNEASLTWIDSVIQVVEDVWDYYENQGWTMPPGDCDTTITDPEDPMNCDNNWGGDPLYDIQLIGLGSGSARPQHFIGSPYNFTRTSFINLTSEDDMPWFHTMPETFSHELMHAIQYTYNGSLTGSNSYSKWYEESSAVYQSIIYDQITPTLQNIVPVNPSDYKQTPFHNTDVPLHWTDDYYDYANVVWCIFLDENYSNSFDKQIWEVFSEGGNNPNLISVTDNLLDSLYDSNLADALDKYSVARYFTGEHADSNNYFMDWLSRDSKIFSTHRDTITVSSDSTKVYELGGTHFIEYIPGNSGFISVNFDGEDNQGVTNYLWNVNLFMIPDTTNYYVNEVISLNLDNYNAGNETVFLPASGKLVLAPVLCEWEQTYQDDDTLHLSYEYSFLHPSLCSITFKNEFNQSDIGDSLTVIGNTTGILDFSEKVVSGSNLQLPVSEQFSVRTDIESTQWGQSDTTIMHHRWGSDASEFRLSHDFTVPSFPIDKIANFEKLDSVRIVNEHDARIQIKDPWFVDNGDQNNEFRVLTDSTYSLFLDQNPAHDEMYYAIKTIEQIGTDSLWFAKWIAFDSDYYEDVSGDWAELASPQSPDSCMVIFKQEHAIVRAMYSDVSGAPATPTGFNVNCSGDYPVLTWNSNTEKDLSHYKVYYQYYTGRPPQTWFSYSVTDTTWTDDNFGLESGSDHARYKVSAVDVFDNESSTTGTGGCDGDVGTWPARKTYRIQELPVNYSLHAPYPNPFNPAVSITVALPEFTGNASLIVFDITGRQAGILVSGPLEAGYHTFHWDGNQHPGGLYILKFTAGSYTETRKMILLK